MRIPLYGSLAEFGYYFADVLIGSPSQRMSVIVDTGSEGISVVCAACKCGSFHMDPFFNPSVSFTGAYPPGCAERTFLRSLPPACIYEKKYLEGSELHGRKLVDKVGFMVDQKISAPEKNGAQYMEFGCIEKETRLFLEQKANGILGLAPTQNNAWLKEKYSAFRVCLSPEGGGDLSLFERTDGTDDVPKIRLHNVAGHYVVSPSSITVEGYESTLALTEYLGKEVLIDSGSTLMYLMPSLFRVILSLIDNRLNEYFLLHPDEGHLTRDDLGPSICWKHHPPAEQISQFSINSFLPQINLNFDSITPGRPDAHVSQILSYTFSNYSTLVDNRHCLTIALNGDAIHRTDLGASWLMGKGVTFATNDGWATIEQDGACTRRLLSERAPVVPIPGQLDASEIGLTIFQQLAVFGFILTATLLIVMHVVRRWLATRTYTDIPRTNPDVTTTSSTQLE